MQYGRYIMVTYLVVYCFNKMLLVHQVDQLISEFCNVAQQVCTAMRTWCREDRLYPKRLWEEIIRTTNRRGKLLEQQKRAERKHRDITQQLDRKRVCQCELDKEVFQNKLLDHISEYSFKFNCSYKSRLECFFIPLSTG